jgi:hypothetical protein
VYDLKSSMLSAHELEIIQDQQFLSTKASASAKIHDLLVSTRYSLEATYSGVNHFQKQKGLFKQGKISKGENYLGLPYQVLDYPAYFSKTDTFAFRTMFWWGNYFSATLHLEGISHQLYKQKFIDNIDRLVSKEIYICVGPTPWQYHFDSDNYQLLNTRHQQHLAEGDFLKLSKKLELTCWQDLPQFSTGFLEQILHVIAS